MVISEPGGWHGRVEDLAAFLIAAGAIASFVFYSRARPLIAAGHYSPRLAWLRAALYFCGCTLISWRVGVLQTLLHTPIIQPGQIGNRAWWILTLLVAAQLIFGYVYLWPRGTTTHGRPRRLALDAAFGLMWGLAQGQLVLCLFAGIERLVTDPVWIFVSMLLLVSTFTGLWHSRFWDVKVSPDHNIYEWNVRKVLFAHTPFLVLSLLQLTLFHNAALFVFAQAAALTAASIAMRFPAPWDPPLPQHDGTGVRLAA